MDANESSTYANEDNDVLNLWKTLHHDLSLEDMPPLVNDSNSFIGDDSSFATASQYFSKDKMPTHLQVGACNVTTLKISTPIERC